MKNLSCRRYALSVFVAASWLVGCGGSHAPTGTPGALPNSGKVSTVDENHALIDASNKSCPTAACIYVANSARAGRITVYSANATGNVRPYRKIAGEKTGLTNPTGVAVDSQAQIYVSLPEGGSGDIEAILTFSAAASGNVKALRTITGPATRLQGPWSIALDADGNVYARNTHVTHRCVLSGCLKRGFVTEYAAGSHGNVAPIRVIRGAKTKMFDQGGGIGVDSAGNVYVTSDPSCYKCKGPPAILVYDSRVDGNSAPSWTISGSKTGLNRPGDVAVDDAGNVYVADSLSVYVYAAGEHGNVAPFQAISGSNTELNGSLSLAVDAKRNIYVANGGYPGSITVYAAGATGNVAPIQAIGGSKTELVLPAGIAVH